MDCGAAIRMRRTKLSHHLIPVRDQHHLSRGGKFDVLAELVFEVFDTDGFHISYCSYWWLLFKNASHK